MKKIYLLTKVCFFAAMMFFAAACTEDDAVVTPIFPEGETVETVVPGTEYTLTFSANMNWELESSKPWCKFSNGFQSIKGEAGENISQKVIVTTDGLTLEDEIAEITLKMGEEEKVIAKYTREGLVPTVTDANGNVYGEENPLVFKYENDKVEATVTFIANFSWVLSDTDIPEWIKIKETSEIGGNAGDKVLVSFFVPEEYWLTAQEGTIKIKNTEIGCEFNVPVTFDGIQDGEIAIVGINGSAYWWKIAADGKSFWKEGSTPGGESESEVSEIPFEFKVMTKENKYKIVHVEQSGQYLNVIEDKWQMPFMTIVDDNNGNVKIESVSANDSESERSAYILVMPTAVYEEMKQKVEAAEGFYEGILFTDEGDGISTGDDTHVNYDKYTVLAFKQEKAESTEGEFVVKDANAVQPIECLQGDGGTGLGEFLASEYSVDNSKIYSISVASGTKISIDPMLSMSEWDGNVTAMDFSGSDVDRSQWEMGMNQAENGYIYSTIPINDSFLIVFKKNNNVALKALIIQVNE